MPLSLYSHKPRNRRAMETPTTRKEIESMRADAVILFSTGHIQEASRMWHGVVRRLLPLVMGALSEPGEAVEEAAVPAPRLNGEFWVHFPGDVTRSPSSSSSKIASGDRAFAVYASALEYVVNPRFDQTLYDDLALAATSVFNLGLCHHLQALLLPGGGGTRDATKSYEKALRRAYGASQRVMDESGLGTFLEAASHQRHGLGLLQLALANNVGHIHDQMHSHDGVRQQLLTLHGLLLLSSPPLDRPLANAAPSPLSTSIEAWLDLYAPFLLTAALYPDCDKACQPAPCA